MRRLFAITVILAAVLAACDDGDDGQNNVTSLEIINDSNIEISEVIWNNVIFVNSQNSIKPGLPVTKDVEPGNGYIYFKKKGDTTAVRTQERVTIYDNEQKKFKFANNTLITEINSSDTISKLSEFYAKPWMLVKQNTVYYS